MKYFKNYYFCFKIFFKRLNKTQIQNQYLKMSDVVVRNLFFFLLKYFRRKSK
jgi:hypothetical protein